MHPWRHYVALGDSFTEGVGDPVDGFAPLGAVDHLAAASRQANPISASPTWPIRGRDAQGWHCL